MLGPSPPPALIAARAAVVHMWGTCGEMSTSTALAPKRALLDAARALVAFGSHLLAMPPAPFSPVQRFNHLLPSRLIPSCAEMIVSNYFVVLCRAFHAWLWSAGSPVYRLSVAVAFRNAGIRLVDVVVSYTPGGAGFYVSPDTWEYLVELDVDAPDAPIEGVICGAQARAQRGLPPSPAENAGLPPHPRPNTAKAPQWEAGPPLPTCRTAWQQALGGDLVADMTAGD